MRSVAEDLNTQAKIRDAAITRFPVDGLNGTTIRAIAADAGVSPGLVIHHFGSKDGLHRACDEYVVHRMMDLKRQAMESGSYRHGGAISTMYQMALPALHYMAWTLGTGSETAARIFDELIDDVTTQLADGRDAGFINEVYGDPRKQAAILVAMQFAGLVFHEHLTRAFGVDMLTAEGLAVAAPYTLQIFSGDLFDKEVIAQTKEALAQLEQDREETS